MLTSWKEIASYLGRGVRTVQRYEREHQMPVRRMQGKPHAAVLALAKDLDEWLRRTPLHSLESSTIESLRNTHLLEEHQKAINRLKCSLLAFNGRLVAGQRICMRKRWFGQEDR